MHFSVELECRNTDKMHRKLQIGQNALKQSNGKRLPIFATVKRDAFGVSLRALAPS
jgi:hypothetical protein